MNILIFPSWYPTKEYPLSGIFFKEQARALYEEGVNTYVLFLNAYSIKNSLKFIKTGRKNVFFNENGIKTYIINYLNIFPRMKLFFYYYSAGIFKKYLNLIMIENKIQFDLVHIHSALNAGIIYYLSKIPIKFVITEHSSLFSRNLLSFWDKIFLPKVFSSAASIITVGNGLKQQINKYTGKEISIIYNIVSMNAYSCQIDENKTKFRFFSLGMHSYVKGFDILISAYSKTKILELTELFIAGLKKQEIYDLQEIINDKQIKNVKLFGEISREDVAYNMFNCDCFVLPSRFETFGVVFAEAMFFGKPVIASRTGGPDSFVTPETGILVSVGNVEETAKALEQIYIHQKEYDTNYIAQYAKDNFSSRNITRKIINIYEKYTET